MNRRKDYVVFAGGMVLTVALIAVVAWGLVNREWIYDYVRGMTYQPTAEMSLIRDKLKLTEEGKFLFNAAQPELNERDSFNSSCRSAVDTEVAVLGCYAAGNIHIYNIVEDELAGIRELTTAHELLHANWARMSEEEKRDLVEPLTRTFDANRDLLESEITTYNVDERQEELYVRAGTEVANLPDVLEKHYAEVFSDQDLVVSFYNSYIKVFREIEAEMDALKAEMDAIMVEVNAKTAEYEQRANQLEAEVESFNNCARTEGCFVSIDEFYVKRNALLSEQNDVEALYNEIDNLIREYNSRVEKYNADITRHETLDKKINSSVKVDEIE